MEIDFCENGYKYWLQIDDDTFVTESIPYNIVERFTDQGIKLGVRRRYYKEYLTVITGLAEFTRLEYIIYFYDYFLTLFILVLYLSHSYWMNSVEFTPQGPILERLQLHGSLLSSAIETAIDGTHHQTTITPVHDPTLHPFNSQTYDRDHYYQGCFMIWSVDLWYERSVQDYVQTVVRSNQDITLRWQEQVFY